MRRSSRWRSVRRDGPGRLRLRLAAMFEEQLGITIDPCDLWVQNPAYAKMDLARWGGDGRDRDGRFVHVCSWERMADVVRSGRLAVVTDDPLAFEVCAGEREN